MQIISGTIKADIVFKNDNILIFKDINPQAKLHYIIIPYTQCTDFNDFMTKSTNEEIILFFKNITTFTKKHNIKHFTLKMNTGSKAGQEVFHFHLHLLSNE